MTLAQKRNHQWGEEANRCGVTDQLTANNVQPLQRIGITDNISNAQLKNTIRDGGSTALYTAYTVYTGDMVYTVDTVDTACK